MNILRKSGGRISFLRCFSKYIVKNVLQSTLFPHTSHLFNSIWWIITISMCSMSMHVLQSNYCIKITQQKALQSTSQGTIQTFLVPMCSDQTMSNNLCKQNSINKFFFIELVNNRPFWLVRCRLGTHDHRGWLSDACGTSMAHVSTLSALIFWAVVLVMAVITTV